MFTTGRTVHVARKQWHRAWDHRIPPIAHIASGATVDFDCLDASCGQIGPDATVATLHALDFSQVDQVNGPIYVEGAEPGDTLEVEFVDFQPAEWGWTAVIPGFGLLADEFTEPALKIWQLSAGWAEFAAGIRIPLEPFCGEVGLAPGVAGPLSAIPPHPHGGKPGTKHPAPGGKHYPPGEGAGGVDSQGDGEPAPRGRRRRRRAPSRRSHCGGA